MQFGSIWFYFSEKMIPTIKIMSIQNKILRNMLYFCTPKEIKRFYEEKNTNIEVANNTLHLVT